MGLEELLGAMRAEAEEEAAELEARGEEEAQRIVEEARRRADELIEDRVAAAEPRLLGEAARRRAHARLEAERCVRTRRAELVDEIIDAIRERLATLRENDEYRELFARLLAEARSAVPAGSSVRVDPRDADLAEQLVAQEDGLEVVPALERSGGLELEAEDGRLARNTFDARLDSAEGTICVRVSAALEAMALDGREEGHGEAGIAQSAGAAEGGQEEGP